MRLWRRIWGRITRWWRPEPVVIGKREWTDRRLPALGVTLTGGCAFEDWLLVDRPECLQVWNVLALGRAHEPRELALVLGIEDGRVKVKRGTGGTRMRPHPPGTEAAIVGVAMPENAMPPPTYSPWGRA